MRFQLDFPVIQNKYKSTLRSSSWFARKCPSIKFYLQVVRTVIHGAKLARKGQYLDRNWCRSSFDIFKALESTGVQIEIKNLDALIELKEPSVIVGNHMSTLETFILPYLICPHKKVTFIIKESLVEYPVFKHIMISRNPIVVGRSNPKQDFQTVLTEGTKRIEEGYSLIVFPQTTRMVNFDKSMFNSIGVKLAKRANVPVTPLALKTDCWGNGNLLKDFGKIDPSKSVKFEFGKSIYVTGNGKDQQEQVVNHIETCLNNWKD